MDEQDKHAGEEEVKRLQRCINDLVSLLALPAIWSGGDASQIARTLMDVLQRLLQLDLIYVQINDPTSGAPVELARVAQFPATPSQVREIRAELHGLLGDDPQKWPSRSQRCFRDKNISIAPQRLGLEGEIGMVVAGTDRSDFPIQTEELLFRVAANQAVMALHEARRRSEQKRLADELDLRVAQRTAELAAASEQLKLQLGLLDLIPVATWTIRPDGTPDFINQKWLEYTGQSVDYVLSEPEAWTAAVHPDDREVALSTYWEGIRCGRDFAMETRCRRVQDGTYRWHLNRAVALRDAEGKIIKFVGTSTDIEDLKQFQEKLRGTEAELAKMTRVMTVSQLTASIAHEVNQPLSGIITNAGTCLRMLDADPPNIEGARETARRTIRDGNRASEVITRLRAMFSRRQATTEPVDINEVAKEVVALLLSKLQREGVILRCELADNLPLVAGDRVQLQQVIMNLLQNASDAMIGLKDCSGQMLIQTQRDETDNVRVTVQDSGIGLDPQTASRLFDAFYTTKNGGMGIGLSVSRWIVENHQGRIWAQANNGPGDIFIFHSSRRAVGEPAEFGSTSRRQQPASEHKGFLMDKHSLVSVVDDDESVRESLPDLLKEFGFAVQSFKSGEEFLASSYLEQTKCVILDIAMPGMSGFDVQRELTGRNRPIPVVFITAQRDENAWSNRLGDNAVACLLKPFSDTALLAAIRTALGIE